MLNRTTKNGSGNGVHPDAAIVNGHDSVSSTGHDLLWDSLSPAVTEKLSQPLDPSLVSERKGRGGRSFSYIEGHTVIDQANRIFGFGGWGFELVGEVALREQSDTRLDANGLRSVNGNIGLRVPSDVVRAKCATYMRGGKPVHRAERLHDSPYSIMSQYQAEFRGIANYYRRALNLTSLDHLRWVMELSLAKTLASKLKISVPQVFKRYQTTIQTDKGPRKVLMVDEARPGQDPLVAYWGGISLARDTRATLVDKHPPILNGRTELVERLLADTCELCGSAVKVQVHHVRALKDLRRKGRAKPPVWMEVTAARRRKTLVVWVPCHVDIHAGRPLEHSAPAA